MSVVAEWAVPVVVTLVGGGFSANSARIARKAKLVAKEQQEREDHVSKLEEVYGRMYDRAQGVNDKIVVQLREEVDRLSQEVMAARREVAEARTKATTTEERNAELERRLAEQERKYADMERRLKRMQELIEQLRLQGVSVPEGL